MPISAEHPVLQLVLELRQTVEKLEARYPGRRFTLDGHLVGSIGEVLAADRYGLTLYPPSRKTHDAEASDGRKVQIKLTQRESVSLSSGPEHLLVHKLHPDGAYEEIYNGPGKAVWAWCMNRIQKNGQAPISLGRLRSLMELVEPQERLPESTGSPAELDE